MNINKMKNILKLFNCLPILKTDRFSRYGTPIVKGGFIFLPEVYSAYHYGKNFDEVYELVNQILSLTAEQMNSSFHKSWKKIKEAKIEQLVYEQLIHYSTTYGLEALGIYNANSVFVPCEKLNIPKLDIDKIELIVIKGITDEEIKKRILNLLYSGIALKEETINIIIEVITDLEIKLEDILLIKNKEVRIILQEKLNIIPKDSVEFLRFLVYKITGKSLLIKNKEMIHSIKVGNFEGVFELLNKEKIKVAEVFYRFKPIILAFRINEDFKRVINKIRKLAKKYHKPMKQDYINNVTSMGEVSLPKLTEELNKVNIFRKIKLVNALRFRKRRPESVMYKIRNGKSFSCGNNLKNMKNIKEINEVVKENIKQEIKNNIKDRKIFIPEYIKYSLPVSEKQFVGNIPIGTCVEIDKDMVFGIYWNDIGDKRIDLDLSLLSINNKYGWDGDYREGSDILFSGDMASASDGASELFYISRNTTGTFSLMVNFFNFINDVSVPFKIFVAKEKHKTLQRNYMVDPNKILAMTESKMDRKQKIIGLIKIEKEKIKFYFYETDIGKTITSNNKNYMKHSRKYLEDYCDSLLSLNKIIKDNLVGNKDESNIDLSPKNLTKDSILDILINRS